jgi:hypothetical protein
VGRDQAPRDALAAVMTNLSACLAHRRDRRATREAAD